MPSRRVTSVGDPGHPNPADPSTPGGGSADPGHEPADPAIPEHGGRGPGGQPPAQPPVQPAKGSHNGPLIAVGGILLAVLLVWLGYSLGHSGQSQPPATPVVSAPVPTASAAAVTQGQGTVLTAEGYTSNEIYDKIKLAGKVPELQSRLDKAETEAKDAASANAIKIAELQDRLKKAEVAASAAAQPKVVHRYHRTVVTVPATSPVATTPSPAAPATQVTAASGGCRATSDGTVKNGATGQMYPAGMLIEQISDQDLVRLYPDATSSNETHRSRCAEWRAALAKRIGGKAS